MKEWFWNIAYALDMLVNAAFGGERHQTISARWGKSSKVWLWYWGCRVLHLLDPGHCQKAHDAYERMKAEMGE